MEGAFETPSTDHVEHITHFRSVLAPSGHGTNERN